MLTALGLDAKCLNVLTARKSRTREHVRNALHSPPPVQTELPASNKLADSARFPPTTDHARLAILILNLPQMDLIVRDQRVLKGTESPRMLYVYSALIIL